MNHDDEDQIPDFFSFAKPEQRDVEEVDPWTVPPKTNKKKKGKKARAHAVNEHSAGAGVEDADTQPVPLPFASTRVEEDDAGLGLEYTEFPPDRLALVDVDDEHPFLPQGSSYDDVPAATRHEEPWIAPSSPRPLVESPRPVPSKPVAYAASSPMRDTGTFGSFDSHERPESVERPVPRTTRTSIRRESLPTHSPPAQRFVEPKAPPHVAQPHFYGLPTLGFDLGLTKQQSAGNTAGSDGYCCCFDSLADCGDTASARKAKDALLIGSEGGLEVYRVLSNKVEAVGRLDGLRGSVVRAKILPHVALYDDLQQMRPLVAVVLYGVVDASDDLRKGPDTRRRASAASSSFYQTSVEIYSLKTQQHLATLYTSSAANSHRPSRHMSASAGEYTEDLSVTAQGKFVTVASGKSGELFVYSHTLSQNGPEFRCIGKFWTSLQMPMERPAARPPSAGGSHAAGDEQHDRTGAPLFCLSQRWLAIVPPSTSSHVSIQGSPLLSDSNPSPPGLASAVAPPQPAVTCEVTGIDTEDAWSRLTRQAAQGVVKYSQKGIDLGRQGWKELTNPTPQTNHQHGTKDRDVLFPPTKAPPDDPLRMSKEPAMVCIIDLEALLEAEATRSKYPPAPLASFTLADGCNFLSFSPSGLRLLTVSRKGELSTVWDLTRCAHGRVRLPDGLSEHASTNGPRVKLIHRIPRSSPAVVVESAWSRDDDCIAILTMHGTVHLHEIPVHASRSRKRRTTGTQLSAQKAEPTVSVSQGTSPPSSNGGLFGSIKSGWQQVSTQVTDLRAKTSGLPTSFAGFRDATTSVGSASGRVLARGLSQGLSAAKGGASDYWHADDNKIRHKALQDSGHRALKWIRRQSDLFLAIVCQGTVHLHPVQKTHRRKGDEVVSGLKHDKYGQKHFELPSIRTRASMEDGDAPFSTAKTGLHGFWSLRSPVVQEQSERKNSTAPPSSQTNDVETNPPYCPFHVDPRVDIFVFETEEANSQIISSRTPPHTFHTSGHGGGKKRNAPFWLFGEPLPPSTKINTHDDLDFLPQTFRESDLDSEGEGDQVKSFLTVLDEDGKGAEISIRSQVVRGDDARDEETFDDL